MDNLFEFLHLEPYFFARGLFIYLFYIQILPN